MAASLQSTGMRPLTLDPKPSLSLNAKAFVGPKCQSSGTFGCGPRNINSEFFARVHRSLSLGLPENRAPRARVVMMPIGIPRVRYRNPGDRIWQWVDLWNALYRERVIFIGKHIDEEFSNQVLGTMLYLDSIEASKTIYLYINGPGGDITPSMALYDTMQSLQSPVGTRCMGYAQNMAGFILAAGDKGNRIGMPSCRVTLQPPAGVVRGQADDIQNEANELLRIRDYLYEELAKQTGQPLEKIHEDLRMVKYFNAKKALEYGLIDRILKPAFNKVSSPRKDAERLY